MTDRSDLRTAVLSAADDWHSNPSSWAAGTDPLKILLTIKESGDIDPAHSGRVFMAVSRYVTGATDRQHLAHELAELIPDGDITPE